MLYLPVCMKTQPTREENRIILFAVSMAYVGESMSHEEQYILKYKMQCKPNYTLKTNIQITYTNSTHRDFALFSLIAQKKKHKKYFIQCHCQNYFEKTCLWFVAFSFLQIHSGYAVHGQLHQETLRHFVFYFL